MVIVEVMKVMWGDVMMVLVDVMMVMWRDDDGDVMMFIVVTWGDDSQSDDDDDVTWWWWWWLSCAHLITWSLCWWIIYIMRQWSICASTALYPHNCAYSGMLDKTGHVRIPRCEHDALWYYQLLSPLGKWVSTYCYYYSTYYYSASSSSVRTATSTVRITATIPLYYDAIYLSCDDIYSMLYILLHTMILCYTCIIPSVKEIDMWNCEYTHQLPTQAPNNYADR